MLPLGNFVVIKPTTKKETESGLLIAETVAEFRQEGDVVAVGPGKEGERMFVEVGDHVFFNKYSDAVITYKGEEHVIVSQDQIFLILND